MEMRLNVLNLTLKIRSHRPRVVCFVGKKIWDVYVSVVSKTARPAIGVKLEVDLVKLEVPQEKIGSEEVKLEMEEVKVEPIVKLESQQDLADRTLPSPSRRRSIPSPSRRSKKPPPTPFNWNSPRSLRLPHPDGRGYTYFWVTPNTSGLERTPVRPLSFTGSVSAEISS